MHVPIVRCVLLIVSINPLRDMRVACLSAELTLGRGGNTRPVDFSGPRAASTDREGEGESDAASAGGERASRLCGVLFTPL